MKFASTVLLWSAGIVILLVSILNICILSVHNDDVSNPYERSDKTAYDFGRINAIKAANPPVEQLCRQCTSARVKTGVNCRNLVMEYVNATRNTEKQASYRQAQLKVAETHRKRCAACHPDICAVQYEPGLRLDQAAPDIVREKVPTMDFLYENPRRFFAYNPTMVPNPSSLPGAYLASFRISNVHSCGSVAILERAAEEKNQNHLGIALMDQELNILSMVVVDVNSRVGPWFKRENIPVAKFEDYRLFVKDNVLFVGDGRFVLPIEISATPSPSALSVIYGENLYVTPLRNDSIVDGLTKGKNYNFFYASTGSLFVEIWPYRTVAQIIDAGDLALKTAPVSLEGRNCPLPLPAFKSDLRKIRTSPWGFGQERNTACCVRLEKEYYQDLVLNDTILGEDQVLVGISHAKSHVRLPLTHGQKFGFLSRLYATSSKFPARVLALSGLFCFGFASVAGDPMVTLTRTSNLEIRNTLLDCPVIHFPTGIVEKIGDSSMVVVAYGINDCHSRFVEIEKRIIAKHLFSSLPK